MLVQLLCCCLEHALTRFDYQPPSLMLRLVGMKGERKKGGDGRRGKGREMERSPFPMGPPFCFLPNWEEMEGRGEKKSVLIFISCGTIMFFPYQKKISISTEHLKEWNFFLPFPSFLFPHSYCTIWHLLMNKGEVWCLGFSLVWIFELFMVFTTKSMNINVSLQIMLLLSSLVIVIILKPETIIVNHWIH